MAVRAHLHEVRRVSSSPIVGSSRRASVSCTANRVPFDPGQSDWASRRMTQDIELTRCLRIEDLTADRGSMLQRFEHLALPSPFEQIGWDDSQSLLTRIHRSRPDGRQAGRPFGRLAVPVACSAEFSAAAGGTYDAVVRHGALAATAMSDNRRAL